jgi:alkylation response protein AidB-like acyl-CoA dehydrogenase
MTDGAARVIELYGTEEMKTQILPYLTSSNSKEAYLSGQWMTERPGGSDVSMTETTASAAQVTSTLPTDLGPPYLLSGFKWFSSAAEGHMAVALARTGNASSGSRGLSAFIIPLRMGPYTSPLENGVRMHRLKNKFGTHGLPTAELELENTRGWMIGAPGAGVKTIATMLNITRLYSAFTALGGLQRALSIARSYATVRSIAGGNQLLAENPLHIATLASVTVHYHALAQISFSAAQLLGKVECQTATGGEEARLRLLTPVLKGFVSLKAVDGVEECMTALGGQGYMEETGIGRLIRDGLVERIWEGTVNILALDLLRAAKQKDAVSSFIEWAYSVLDGEKLHGQDIRQIKLKIRECVDLLPKALETTASNPLAARATLMFVGVIWSALCLFEQATWSYASNDLSLNVDAEVLRRWVEEGELDVTRVEVERLLGMNKGAIQKRIIFDGQIVFQSGETAKAKM